MIHQRLLKVGVTSGDVNGVGLEIVLRSFSEGLNNKAIVVLYASENALRFYQRLLNCSFDFHVIENEDAAVQGRLNLMECVSNVTINPGVSTLDGGRYALESLSSAVDSLLNKKIDVLVTSPINKHNIQSSKFEFPGHTEYLGRVFGVDNPLMLMCSSQLRIGVVTGHIPLSKVSSEITSEKIIEKITQMKHSIVKDFGIKNPKIAVLGLNPHAGDQGLLGKEDSDILEPAILYVNRNKEIAFGPFPADGFFGSKKYLDYDGVLAMYHDQGLVPFKALAFESGVNFTAGLSVVRASPAHGVAYDIAGKGHASLVSFIAAIEMACKVYLQRNSLAVN